MLKHKLKRCLAFMCALVLAIGSISIGSVFPKVDSYAADTTEKPEEATPVYLEGFKNRRFFKMGPIYARQQSSTV